MNILSVARQAGVSTATVSRAFNTPDLVTDHTREIVQAAATRVGYTPNLSARTLRTNRSRVLGVILPTLRNPVFAECLTGIASAAAASRYSIIPLTTDYHHEREQDAVASLISRGVDGMILTVANAQKSPTLAALRKADVPFVLAYNRTAKHPCVSVDGELAMAELVNRLVKAGHQQITMVSGTLKESDRAAQRYKGYCRAMKRQRKKATLIEISFLDSAIEELTQFMRQPNRPTALVCSNDLLAVRCIRAAYLAGVSVPLDVSIVGFDGISLGGDLTPSLATIAQPSEEIGRQAAAWMIDCLSRHILPSSKGSITLQHNLLSNESMSGAPRIPPTDSRIKSSRRSSASV